MSSRSALPLFVGIGTSGRRALRSFIERGMKADYVLVSNTNMDRLDEVKFVYFREGSEVDFGEREAAITISSLAGNTGPYLSHHVARALAEKGTFVISVAYPPFPFENSKKFKASNALRRLSQVSNLVLLVDNEFYFKKASRLPLNRYYAEVNEELATVMDFLVNDVGALDAVRALGSGLAVVSVGLGGDLTDNMARLIMKVLGVTGVIDYGVSFISGEEVPSPKDLEKTYKGLSLIGDVREVRAGRGTSSAAAIAVVSESELMKYDPVAKILGDRVLDLEPEAKLSISLPIDRID